MPSSIKLEVQSAIGCLEEALNALERARGQAEKRENISESVAVGTDAIDRACNSIQSAIRTLETDSRRHSSK